MILTIYIIILSFFALGGIAFYIINQKKDKKTARASWLKFGVYFIIINVLFLCIAFAPQVFRYIVLVIILVGAGELLYLFKQSNFRNITFFGISLIIFLIFSAGFYFFSQLDYKLILFTFLILSIFDAFSQISGQLFGKNKVLPRISPGKTVEGVLGGAVIAIITSFLFHNLTGKQTLNSLLLVIAIIFFALTGDALASLYKRKYGVKDFSQLLPGHGGFLDRFDSLIAGGAVVGVIENISTKI
ncbi:phosphatidate cytidylyltransferase [Tangfeifania diversioriginum]|uniref:Phosphatidate cytidylyltransferase n=1 Tax=Tangfeifania diversioriginum TaxID=1168035 RepID=A0A1M6IMB3_9BACT|nr:phosphatidate cytidylyltransferase [Tangfeifania diversioriginum]SHJ35564.1 phosphatidate cytidylyltransferase [Tangfeifania diversioriginum]